ncbi:hypothetical protein HH310_28970 [Actinoplanes sp. TBRC 11911]|uniref:hypothetical protein n=1 Tax=Actinoplanes sp. TBRC 11911 TaxID=2729386 RepID=UPI00145F3BB1|nr:hypothetical protein [Actinoplanes sp. TBRC 11911]NMO55204.1 hypothetical protein [Actinoplanes sp. TBRC 11911]
MTGEALEVRRLVGKVVLFLVLCWVVVLIAGVAGAAGGASFDPLNVALAVLPGCAFVPAAYFAVRLHTTTDPVQAGRLWPKTLVCGAAGVLLLAGAAYALYAGGQS